MSRSSQTDVSEKLLEGNSPPLFPANDVQKIKCDWLTFDLGFCSVPLVLTVGIEYMSKPTSVFLWILWLYMCTFF